jgi:hypothetical protein
MNKVAICYGNKKKYDVLPVNDLILSHFNNVKYYCGDLMLVKENMTVDEIEEGHYYFYYLIDDEVHSSFHTNLATLVKIGYGTRYRSEIDQMCLFEEMEEDE